MTQRMSSGKDEVALGLAGLIAEKLRTVAV